MEEEKKKESMEVNRHNSIASSLLDEMPYDYSSLASSRIFDMIKGEKRGSSSSSSSWFIDSSSLVQDLGSSTIFDFLQQTSLPLQAPLAPLAQATSSSASALVETSEVLNLAATPNASSISSSSSEPSKVINVVEEEEEDEDKDQDQDQDKSSKKQSKTDKEKKSKKWPRAPRFAFMTKSEVDHLDDSYRWRKYGQKAVKNSPFPRSYYRCTTAACGVKKRVERSCTDPTIVITTYEGQHTHPIPQTARGHLAGYLTMPLQMTQTEHFYSQQQFPSNLASPSHFGSSSFIGIDRHQRHFQPSLSEYRIPDHGLLEDTAPTDMRRE